MSSHESVCPNCNARMPAARVPARIPEPTARCHACDTPLAARDDLPPIYLTTRDYGRLESLARLHSPCDAPVARFLSAELERAVVCQPSDIFDDVVTLNARVLFRTGTFRTGTARDPEARVLVSPDRYFPTGQYLTILSPLGVALLGLREGSRMPFVDRQGSPCHVVVEKVVYQPAMPGRPAP
jgi:regulator of nucleoside diphosphate kinase